MDCQWLRLLVGVVEVAAMHVPLGDLFCSHELSEEENAALYGKCVGVHGHNYVGKPCTLATHFSMYVNIYSMQSKSLSQDQ